MSDRYKHKNGDILDGSCGDTGHTMFLVDVVRQLNRIARLEAENKRLEHEVITTRGLWCIDRNPKDVDIDWIRRNAFQLKGGGE